MNILLTARSGFTKGASWVLNELPLLIGRGAGCDIVVEERSVSRQHCEVRREAGGVRLRDIGSRNATIVNGAAVNDALLQVGDEFSVGSATFLIAATSLTLERDEARSDPDDAISTAIAETGLFSEEETPGSNRVWMGDSDDLAALFYLGRQLSLSTTLDALFEHFASFMLKRFRSSDFLIARKTGEEWKVAYPPGKLVPRELPTWLARARTRERTFLSTGPTDSNRYLVAPLRCGPTELGVCALPVHNPAEHRVRPDIAAYSAACEIFGPYLSNLERLERLSEANARLVDSHEISLGLIGESRSMQELRSRIIAVSRTDLNVLLLGETGSGKELIAKSIHENSDRKNSAQIIVNCAAIADELFESEFFGHVKGSFTGAVSDKQGLVELAHGGTLVLDEVGELSTINQAKLLRVVEQRTFRRVGEERERSADVRFIAASNLVLASNGFRTDLYHRLGGVVIEVPPLRYRERDIPVLAQYFLDRLFARRPGLHRTLSDDAIAALTSHQWPGNVRELKNVVERAAQLARAQEITVHDLFDHGPIRGGQNSEGMSSLSDIEREHIARVLDACLWNVSKASRALGISRSTLYQKIHDHGLRDVSS